MKLKVKVTSSYEQKLRLIEDFIWDNTEELKALEKFLDEHDAILEFLKINPKNTGNSSSNR